MNILRGPADADHYRVKKGRYGDRWYADPLPADPIAEATDATWPSVTSVKKASGSDWTFVGLKRVAQRLDEQPDTLTGLRYDECYDRLKSINKIGLGRAADRGTMVHTYFERGLRGEDIEQPFDNTAATDYLPAVRAFFDTYQPELVAAELVCINRGLNGVGYGGTCDAIIRIDGKAYIVDWKSRGADSDHGAYPEEAAQIAAYGAADYYITEGPQRTKLPIDLAGGLIVSVKPDGARLYPIDLDKATAHWTALHAWWVARRAEREAIGKPWAPRAAPAPAELRSHPYGVVIPPEQSLADRVASAPTPDALRALWAAHAAEWNDDLTELAKARVALLEGGLIPQAS